MPLDVVLGEFDLVPDGLKYARITIGELSYNDPSYLCHMIEEGTFKIDPKINDDLPWEDYNDYGYDPDSDF